MKPVWNFRFYFATGPVLIKVCSFMDLKQSSPRFCHSRKFPEHQRFSWDTRKARMGVEEGPN